MVTSPARRVTRFTSPAQAVSESSSFRRSISSFTSSAATTANTHPNSPASPSHSITTAREVVGNQSRARRFTRAAWEATTACDAFWKWSPHRFAVDVLSCLEVNCDIKSQTLEELQAQFQTWEQPTYRVTLLLQWLYERRVTSWDAMTNLPKSLRELLKQHYAFNTLTLVTKQGASDTTQKFLWRLHDGALIESVLIPANPALYGEPSDRHTLCVSTQVGCADGCKFCASGLEGVKRNLEVEEIVEQVLAVERWHQAHPQGMEAANHSPPSARLI